MEADQIMSNHCLEKILSLQTGDIAVSLSYMLHISGKDQASFPWNIMIEKGKGFSLDIFPLKHLQVLSQTSNSVLASQNYRKLKFTKQ